MSDAFNQKNDYWQQKMNKAYTDLADEGAGVRQFMLSVYTWMSFGLALTGLVAALTVHSPALLGAIFGSGLLWVLLIAEFGLVIFFGMALRRGANAGTLLAMFLAYSAINGLTLSAVLLVYRVDAVAQAFFVTAGTFGAMSLYGYVTKKDLSGMGHFLHMGVFGLVIAMVVNFFLKSAAFDYLVSLIGVGIFVGLTAYDTQKLKQMYAATAGDEASLKRLALGGALSLYLDFINLFLFMLRLFGGRRR